MAYAISLIILLSVIVGVLPWLTSILHFWLMWSFVHSVPIIDGGDQVALAMTAIFVMYHFGDLRLHHWSGRRKYFGQPIVLRAIWWSALILFSIQGSVIYAHAVLGKLNVPEWANGTSVWYWITDPTFSPPEPFLSILKFVSGSWLGTVLLNYGVLGIEAMLALALLARPRTKIRIAMIGVMLHTAFALAFGLWSFLCSMICVIIMYLVTPVLAFYPEMEGVYRNVLDRLFFFGRQWFRNGSSEHQSEA
ncbi:hypothetical protein [Actinomyces slackii]|nr:hypothetical protein [Actinomyces slackii]